MIRLRVNEQDLDIGEAQINIEIFNPLFETKTIPGTLTLPFTVPITPVNQIALGFPEVRARQIAASEPVPCQLFLKEILWKVGVLNVQEWGGGTYTLNFQSDAGEIQSKIAGVQLSDIDYGAPEPLSFGLENIFPAANHVLFPVRNGSFYAEKNPAYQGFLNYYRGGFLQTGHGLTPFPFLVFILRKVLAQFGYRITGTWVEQEEVRRLVVFSNAALDQAGGGIAPVDYRRHVPDISVGDFLLALQNLFGLGFIFSPLSGEVEIIELREVIRNRGYADRTGQASSEFKGQPSQKVGFTLVQTVEDLDGLTKNQNNAWASYTVGNGSETITTKASTLFMVREQDPLHPGRSWLLPHTEMKGSSLAYDLGESRCHFRLLSYRGLQPDSQGDPYPMGTSATSDYAGTEVGEKSLLWDGPKGLYLTQWKEWLDFRSVARLEERAIRLTVTDLMTMDPKQKWVVDYLRFLFEKISLTVSVKDGLKEAKVELHQVRL